MTNRGREQSPPRQGGAGAPPGESFWRDYLKDGYFDADGNLRSRVVVEEAIAVARRLVEGRTSEREGLTTAQLRRFYDMAKGVETRLKGGTPFPSVIGEVSSLHSHAAAAVEKGKAPHELLRFFEKNLPLAIQDERSFRQGFLMHFQSVVAYFGYEKKFGASARSAPPRP